MKMTKPEMLTKAAEFLENLVHDISQWWVQYLQCCLFFFHSEAEHKTFWHSSSLLIYSTLNKENAWQYNMAIVNMMMGWSITPQKLIKYFILECKMRLILVVTEHSYSLKHEIVCTVYSRKFNFTLIKASTLFL